MIATTASKSISYDFRCNSPNRKSPVSGALSVGPLRRHCRRSCQQKGTPVVFTWRTIIQLLPVRYTISKMLLQQSVKLLRTDAIEYRHIIGLHLYMIQP